MAASSRISNDAHSTTSRGPWSTRRIATTALLCALAFILTFVEIPIFPPAPWLKVDLSGVVAFVAALVFGPATGCITVVLPWVLKTLFSFDVYGHLMAIIASLTLILPATALARKLGGARGLVVGMVAGCAVSIVASVLCNLVVTPLYTAVSVDEVVRMIVPILLPFNLLKTVLLCVVTALIQRPVRAALGA